MDGSEFSKSTTRLFFVIVHLLMGARSGAVG
jgi:hypothetical protein